MTLVISDGPTPVAIPNVAGKSFEEASATLSAIPFTVTRTDQFSDTVPDGTVIGTNPGSGGKAQANSSVAVIGSKGPDLVTVPSLVGDTLDSEQAKLDALGLSSDIRDYS